MRRRMKSTTGIAIRSGLAVVVAALVAPVLVGAHVGDRVYPIPELTDEMLAQIDLKDGSVDEWSELVGEPAMTPLDFKEDFNGQDYDPADLDFRVWLAWHDTLERLYLAAVLSDDELGALPDPSDPSLLRSYDSISMAVDGDHSGGSAIAPCVQGCTEAELLVNDSQIQQYDAVAFRTGFDS